MSSNDSGTYFGSSIFYIRYNTLAFGSNIGNQVNTLLSRGNLFDIPTYLDPQSMSVVDDMTSNIIRILFSVYSLTAPNYSRIELTPTPIPMLHFKLPIENCHQNTGLNFDSTFVITTGYTDSADHPTNDYKLYNKTIFTNNMELMLCEMNIVSFTSPVFPGSWYPGTTRDDWEMVITGLNFGATRGNGNVWFKDANSGGNYDVLLNGIDFLNWSDTEIRIRMPSIIDTSIYPVTNPRIPGSGKFYIKTNIGDSLMSDSSVMMPYAIKNVKLPDTVLKKTRINLVGLDIDFVALDTLGKIIFRSDTSISNNPQIKGCISKAIKEWNCITGVKWELGLDTILQIQNHDGNNMIYFDDTMHTGLGGARVYPAYCTNFANEIIAFAGDIDIRFRRNIIINLNSYYWCFDTTGL